MAGADEPAGATMTGPHDPAEFVARLRAEFTRWAVLHDPFADVWWGLCHEVTLRACSGIALREQILTAQSRPRGWR